MPVESNEAPITAIRTMAAARKRRGSSLQTRSAAVNVQTPWPYWATQRISRSTSPRKLSFRPVRMTIRSTPIITAEARTSRVMRTAGEIAADRFMLFFSGSGGVDRLGEWRLHGPAPEQVQAPVLIIPRGAVQAIVHAARFRSGVR